VSRKLTVPQRGFVNLVRVQHSHLALAQVQSRLCAFDSADSDTGDCGDDLPRRLSFSGATVAEAVDGLRATLQQLELTAGGPPEPSAPSSAAVDASADLASHGDEARASASVQSEPDESPWHVRSTARRPAARRRAVIDSDDDDGVDGPSDNGPSPAAPRLGAAAAAARFEGADRSAFSLEDPRRDGSDLIDQHTDVDAALPVLDEIIVISDCSSSDEDRRDCVVWAGPADPTTCGAREPLKPIQAAGEDRTGQEKRAPAGLGPKQTSWCLLCAASQASRYGHK
jgi:hypothetical protein